MELADLLAELLALCRIAKCIVKDSAGAAHGHCRDGDPCCIEPCVHDFEPAIDLTEDLGIGQAAVVKAQDHVFVAAMADALITRRDLKTRCAAIHKESGNAFFWAFGCLVLARRDKDDDEISVIRAGDKVLRAVDDPIAAIAFGKALHTSHVTARVRFGHRERVHTFAAHGGEQVFLALFTFAGHQDVLGASKEVIERH